MPQWRLDSHVVNVVNLNFGETNPCVFVVLLFIALLVSFMFWLIYSVGSVSVCRNFVDLAKKLH